MKRILCFGDSNTHGYDAVTDGRFDENTRWPGVLANLAGAEYTIIEEGLEGRTTAFEDPCTEGMSGLPYLYPCLMTHKPIDTLIIVLGTNDCKERFSATAYNVACGMKRLVEKAKTTPCWKDKPDIIIVSPAPIQKECESAKFAGEMGICSEKSYHLAEEYRKVADFEGVDFFDASEAEINTVDYMHLTPAGHKYMAEKLWEKLQSRN